MAANTYTWTGSAGNGLWSSFNNWSNTSGLIKYPGETGSTDIVQIALAGASVTFDALASGATIGSLSITGAGDLLDLGANTLNVANAGQIQVGVNSASPPIFAAGAITLEGGALNGVGSILRVNLNSTISGFGSIDVGRITFSGPGGGGTVEASGGLLDVTGTVSLGVLLAINPSLVNGLPSDLKIEGSASVNTISLSSANQTLEIGSAGSLTLSNNAALATTGGTIQLDGGAASVTGNFGISLGASSYLIGAGQITTGTSGTRTFGGAGTVIATGSNLIFNQSVDQSGAATTFKINSNAQLSFDAAVGKSGAGAITPQIEFNGNAGTLNLSNVGFTYLNQFSANVVGFVAGDFIDAPIVSGYTPDQTLTVSGNNIIVTANNGAITLETINVGASAAALSTIHGNVITTAICFMAGTMIRTPDGEAAVETLQRGDLVLSADGLARPVRWLGRQTISTRFADPLRTWPVRIKAGALAENVPVRDLVLSPDHAVLVDGALIHAGALVNDTSIVCETAVPEIFTYYHVELDDHSLILAENAPAETFIDNVERLAFDNWAEHVALYPEGKPIEELPYPRAKGRRQVPVYVRVQLAERAEIIGASTAAIMVA